MWKVFNRDGAEKKAPVTVLRPMAKVVQGTAESLATGTKQKITFAGAGATADFDTGYNGAGLWSAGTPGRLTAPITGRYRLTGAVGLVATGATFRLGVLFYKNGSLFLPTASTNGYAAEENGGSNARVFDVIVKLNAGDYIELGAFQDAGSAFNTIPADTWLAMEYVDPAIPVYVGVPGSLIGQEVAYTEFTSSVNVVAGAPGVTVVTAPALTFDGVSKYRFEFQAPFVDNTAGNMLYLELNDGSVNLGRMYESAGNQSINVAREFIPPAGTRAYSVKAYVGFGNYYIYAGAGGSGVNVPGFLRITRVA